MLQKNKYTIPIFLHTFKTERGSPFPKNKWVKNFARFVSCFVFKSSNVFNLSHNAYCIVNYKN